MASNMPRRREPTDREMGATSGKDHVEVVAHALGRERALGIVDAGRVEEVVGGDSFEETR